METYERIRELRKKHLHLSQTEFGEKLGVSRSVIKNIELNALARPDQKLSLMKLICSEFNVNEKWLLNGTEPMFVQPDTFSLDEFVKANGATKLELEILKAYFELDVEIRQKAINYFKEKISGTSNTATSIEPNNKDIVSDSVEDAETAYIKSRSAFAQNITSSVSNTSTEKNINKASNQ